jgi:CRP-like cAMP-binding protein
MESKFPNSPVVSVHKILGTMQSNSVSRRKKCEILAELVEQYASKSGKQIKLYSKSSTKKLGDTKKSTIEVESLNHNIGTVDRLLTSLSYDNIAEINRYFKEQDSKERAGRKMLPLDYIFALFEVPPNERTDVDLQKLEDFLHSQNHFKKRPDYILKLLSKSLLGERLRQGELCFRQGDQGDKWFYLLRGVVKIQLLNHGTGQIYTVGLVKAGFEFGENALLNDTVRGASAIADTACWVLTLDKPLFLTLLGVTRQAEIKNMIALLAKFPMTSNIDPQGRKQIAERLYKREFSANQTLFDCRKEAKEVMFIFSGRCAVYRELLIPKKE